MKRTAVAVVDEARCIGCTLCVDACPVDAIVGARGALHVVMEPWCIGCALCVAPCPVDCIAMAHPQGRWTEENKQGAKRRAKARRARLQSKAMEPIPDRAAVLAALLGRVKRT